MQLKWRIFLLSLALIMLAVSGSTMTVLHISLSDRVESLIDEAVVKHSGILSDIQNRAAYERMQSELPLLSEDQISAVVMLSLSSKMAQSAGDELCGATVFSKKYTNIRSSFGEQINTKCLTAVDKMETGKCYSCIYEKDNVWRLVIGSVLSIDEYELTVYSAYNINDTFQSYNSNLFAVWLVSIGFSLVISIVLFAVTSSLLRPLSQVNDALGRIAGGIRA